MNTFSHVPPGFRFHPTDEELVDYYLRKKVSSRRIEPDVIKEVDLYKIEPWDLQEKCRIGTEDLNEYYFFSHKDKKYPTGTRTNRATTAGFWKATGRDKAIYSKHNLIGMRKTLVFYQGRAPNGQKSDWIMHEYRLETNENGAPQEESWVVCRVFKKRITAVRKMNEQGSPCWYEEQVSFLPELDSPRRSSHPEMGYNHPLYSCKQELELHYNIPHESFLQLAQLESSNLPPLSTNLSCNSLTAYGLQSSSLAQEEQMHKNPQQGMATLYNNLNEQGMEQMTDWRVLDKFVASQLSHGDIIKEQNYSNISGSNIYHVPDSMTDIFVQETNKQDTASDYACTSNSNCHNDLWK